VSWFRRSAQPLPLPAQVRAGLSLPRGERLLAHAMLANGGWVVATSAALVVVDPVTGPQAGPGTPRARHLWHEVSEATWQACRDHVSDDPKVLLELVAAIGTWRMVSGVLRTVKVPLEVGVTSWPPDGRSPEKRL